MIICVPPSCHLKLTFICLSTQVLRTSTQAHFIQMSKTMTSGPFSETSSSGDMYIDSKYMYARNSRAIGVLWAVFSLCFAIINAVVFVQPQWLGDTATSRGTGYFGLWRSCRLLQDGQDLICEGRLDDFGTIQTPAFRAATVFVGLSVCISSLCVLSLVLFFFMHSSTVFHVCGWMQLSCGEYQMNCQMY